VLVEKEQNSAGSEEVGRFATSLTRAWWITAGRPDQGSDFQPRSSLHGAKVERRGRPGVFEVSIKQNGTVARKTSGHRACRRMAAL